ncbi:hypothetical protein PG988_014454 [Apiospora saccharicola]
MGLGLRLQFSDTVDELGFLFHGQLAPAIVQGLPGNELHENPFEPDLAATCVIECDNLGHWNGCILSDEAQCTDFTSRFVSWVDGQRYSHDEFALYTVHCVDSVECTSRAKSNGASTFPFAGHVVNRQAQVLTAHLSNCIKRRFMLPSWCELE